MYLKRYLKLRREVMKHIRIILWKYFFIFFFLLSIIKILKTIFKGKVEEGRGMMSRDGQELA